MTETGDRPRRVLVITNPRSGLPRSFSAMRQALDRNWDVPGVELIYQFSQSAEDGVSKATQAVAAGFDTILVAGGDGTVSTIGRALLGTETSLGVIPLGSGNGFARHFSIPLSPAAAVAALASAKVRRIDVGMVNDIPFLVTSSMAWESSVAATFERSPVRGIVPYIFAGVQEFFEYEAQDFEITLESGETRRFSDPMVFTVANPSQYGGGARIAPGAEPDDGYLELVVALRRDIAKLLANIGRVFDGSLSRIPEVVSLKFRSLAIRRENPDPIQIDGELVAAGKEIAVKVIPLALKVLVPAGTRAGR